MIFMYDIIVVGGGHAGCEAAHICAFMGNKTLLVTSNINNIAVQEATLDLSKTFGNQDNKIGGLYEKGI